MIGSEEADGILFSEKKIHDNEQITVKYPTGFESKCVRAAHMYNITFSHVRENFAIAGLLPLVKVWFAKDYDWDFLNVEHFFSKWTYILQDSILQFDGVYYQKLMEDFARIGPTERNIINEYRLY